jgi:hypothetical protein
MKKFLLIVSPIIFLLFTFLGEKIEIVSFVIQDLLRVLGLISLPNIVFTGLVTSSDSIGWPVEFYIYNIAVEPIHDTREPIFILVALFIDIIVAIICTIALFYLLKKLHLFK